MSSYIMSSIYFEPKGKPIVSTTNIRMEII
jgi:hypothetical protein